MFGYSATAAIHKAIDQGRFPKPDALLGGKGKKPPRCFWYKKTLDAELARRLEKRMGEDGRSKRLNVGKEN